MLRGGSVIILSMLLGNNGLYFSRLAMTKEMCFRLCWKQGPIPQSGTMVWSWDLCCWLTHTFFFGQLVALASIIEFPASSDLFYCVGDRNFPWQLIIFFQFTGAWIASCWIHLPSSCCHRSWSFQSGSLWHGHADRWGSQPLDLWSLAHFVHIAPVMLFLPDLRNGVRGKILRYH